jgi:hypothetical protein
MCLIIAPGSDGKPALLPEDVFQSVYQKNNDGYGAMWVEDGRVMHEKTLGLTAEQEYARMKELTEQHPDVIFHMRYKTHGKVIPSLCHPFRILHKSRHGKDLFFMHNGVLGGFGNNLTYGQSDTTKFKDKILVPLLTRDPNALDDPSVWEALNKLTSGSRLIFLDSEGKVLKTSESGWNNRYGLTLSNTYMLPSLNYTGNYASQGGKVYTFPSEGDDLIGTHNATYHNDEKKFPLWRIFKSSSDNGKQEYGLWCRRVTEGFVRTEQGTLYRDHGTNVPIFFDRDYIAKADEITAITEETKKKASGEKKATEPYVPAKDDPIETSEDFVDDDIPWHEESKHPATKDECLRYARIVHNCHDGNIVSRENMLADIVCMGNKELLGFIKDDPENAEIVISELIETIMEFNEVLSRDPTCEDLCLDYDALTEMGSEEHHQASMKQISDKRKEYYATLAAQVALMEESKKKAERKVA